MVVPTLIASGCVVLGAMLVFALHRRSVTYRTAVFTGFLILGVGAGAMLFVWSRPGTESHLEREPDRSRTNKTLFRFPQPVGTGYVGSSACKDCHAEQFTSWHASYHRTMTQPATPETVLAPFDGVQLQTDGLHASLSRQEGEFFVETFDPAWERAVYLQGRDARSERVSRRIKAKVVMVTGSHHFQVFWIRSPTGSELLQFPWRFELSQRRWMHRKDVFLGPPGFRPGMHFRLWNSDCILCHSTGGQPGLDRNSGVMEETRVAELGISCEACHGPAKQHVALMRGRSRENRPPPNRKEPAVIHPLKLSHRLSSQVCGQCHSHFRHSRPSVMQTGVTYRPGDELTNHGEFITPARKEHVSSRYWSDGACRSGGREFNGMKASACYLQGKMSCMSCHSMHQSKPNDQLADQMRGNRACYQCHAEYEAKLTEHTHHPASSSGSLCYNCHMPHTSYALLKAIRSHRIDSPRVSSVGHNSRPNACNLCHLDRTLDWTGRHLNRWYGTPAPELTDDERQTAASVIWLLRGDAGQRVVAAWHAGWAPALKASGSDWIAPILAQSLDDPYSAVRWVAYRSLKHLPGFKNFRYDFDGRPRDRAAAVIRARDRWESLPDGQERNAPSKDRPQVLLKARRKIDKNRLKQILKRRDDKPLAIVE